ncbi:Glutamate receptor ionotropic, kainate 1, partial [Cichlidogyrus casuarinus]
MFISIASRYGIPYISTAFVSDTGSNDNIMSINLHPSNQAINEQIFRYVDHLNWNQMALIHVSDQAMSCYSHSDQNRFSALLKYANFLTDFEKIVKIRKWGKQASFTDSSVNFFLDPSLSGVNYVGVSPDKVYNFIVDIPKEEVKDFLISDTTTMNLKMFKVNEKSPNIHTFTLYKEAEGHAISNSLKNALSLPKSESTDFDSTLPITLYYDAVIIYGMGLVQLSRERELSGQVLNGLSQCMTRIREYTSLWPHGLSLINTVKAFSYNVNNTLSGEILFRSDGLRTSNTLHFYKLTNDVPQPNMKKDILQQENNPEAEIENKWRKTLKVITKLEKPFVTVASTDAYGNAVAYKGYCIDILDKLSSTLLFKYEIETTDEYGGCIVKTDGVGQDCTGMVGALVDG